jgi:thioesterase domain-containing protein
VITRDKAPLDPAELRTFLLARLASFKVPRRILVLDAFPLGPTMKPQLSVLSEMVVNRPRHIVPPLQPLEYQIVDVWRRLLKRADVGVEDDFFDLGGDSLLATNMLLEIEEITGRPAPEAAIADVITVRGISNAYANEPDDDRPLIAEASPGVGRPFVFCHGDYTTRGFYAYQLVKEMGLKRPVLLAHPDFDRNPDQTIEQRATAYVDELVRLYPKGDVDLGGFCNGGLLAWEIGRQLAERGRRVQKLVLIDTASLNVRPLYRLAAPLVQAFHGRVNWMASIWNLAILERGPTQILARIRDGRPAPADELDRLWPMVLRVMSCYFPRKLATDLYCLISEKGRTSKEFQTQSWRPFVNRVWTGSLTGNHKECVTTYGPDTARLIAALLADEQARPRRARAAKSRQATAAAKAHANDR